MKTDGGYVRLYRRVWENPIFRNEQEAAVFAWMISMAQWQDNTINTKFGQIKLHAGELIVAERDLSARFGLDRNAVQRLLKRMSEASMIRADRERVTSRIGTIVAVLNFKDYQGLNQVEIDVVSQSPASCEPMASPSGAKNKEEIQERRNEERDLSADAANPTPNSPPDVAPAAKATKRKKAPDEPSSTGTRIPPGWRPSPIDEKFALALHLDPAVVLADFVDYWTAKAGPNARKANWSATWRGWCRRQRPPPTAPKLKDDWAVRRKAEIAQRKMNFDGQTIDGEVEYIR